MNNWNSKGLIYKPKTEKQWMKSHCQLPTPVFINDSVVRVYFAGRSDDQRSTVSFFDFDLKRMNVVNESVAPVLNTGGIGTFDEHGVFPASVIDRGNEKWMYYIGWNQGVEQPLFYASIGLAISKDNGESFTKYSKAPIISRGEYDPCLVTSPYVLFDENIWKMWYVSGIKWERVEGRLKSFYHIKYAWSIDGINWERKGDVSIDFKYENESNIARPTVIKDKQGYKMWYSYVNAPKLYQIGYAESKDGISFERKDEQLKHDFGSNEFDSDMQCYPNIVMYKNKMFMFYNGNYYGKHGVFLAVSE